jgi:hypothetical protein
LSLEEELDDPRTRHPAFAGNISAARRFALILRKFYRAYPRHPAGKRRLAQSSTDHLSCPAGEQLKANAERK